MKKLNIFMTALMSLGLVACSENFDPKVGPQSNAQESVLQVSDVTMSTLLPDEISLDDYIDEETGAEIAIPVGVATVKEGAMPANTVLHAVVMFSRDADFENFADIVAEVGEDNEITVSPSSLQDAYFNLITKNPNTTTLYMRTVLGTVTGGEAAAIIGKPGENFYAVKAVQFTPLNKLTIAPAYYIIGGPNSDWAGSATARSIKFQHSDQDVSCAAIAGEDIGEDGILEDILVTMTELLALVVSPSTGTTHEVVVLGNVDGLHLEGLLHHVDGDADLLRILHAERVVGTQLRAAGNLALSSLAVAAYDTVELAPVA